MDLRKRVLAKVCVGTVLWAMPSMAWAEPEDHNSDRTPLVAQEATAASTQVTENQRQGSPIDQPGGGGTSQERPWFVRRLLNAYVDEFKGTAPAGEELPRRALPTPWDAPPFPSSEYQGYPLIGVPYSTKEYPLMRAINEGPFGDAIRASRVKAYGWINGSYNWSTNKNSNMPTSYWIVPNSIVLNQAVFRLEREVDTVQTDHIDIGFRATALYGIDYRYMTAGGWQPASNQLLKQNQRYGMDPTEMYIDTYIPWIAQGLTLRIGRWIACPDIETQFAPDNYLGTHSILFTYDTYTQTGVMATVMLNRQWMVQAALHAGTDMAPWYQGAIATGMFGVRWVSLDNKDSVYLVLNNINNAKFRRFDVGGQPAGHDNFNYIVGTWQHAFTREIITKTEAYYMWQEDAVVGGTPSIGPLQSFGGGGGIGATLPGTSLAYGVVNYTMFQTTKRDYLTFRNEWWVDERGMRTGFAGHYFSSTLGWSHQFNDVVMIRPEVGYYRNFNRGAFDLGTEKAMTMAGVDMTFRF